MSPRPDPYATLGVSATATDAELRSAYRRLVQLHHPDHNGGSAESARRFEEVQEAYATAREQRQAGGGRASARRAGTRGAGTGRAGSTAQSRPAGAGAGSAGAAGGPGAAGGDPNLGSRLAAMEAELRAARDDAMRKARAAAARAQSQTERPSDEELGYISTDDSFSKILHDAASGLSDRLDDVQKEARQSPVTKRFADLIDELGSKLTGEPPDRS
jgi:curved DNA-binding protein CbpA